jgi:PKD repeat protein
MKKIILIFFLAQPFLVLAQPGNILSFKKLSAATGGLSGIDINLKYLGLSTSLINDIDKDGTKDIAIGVYDESKLEGNLFVLFMKEDFSVKSYYRIGPNIGGFNGTFSVNMSQFGANTTLIDDLDKDGINELAVGNSSGGVNNMGEIYILFLNSNGIVRKWLRIGSDVISLNNNSYFGKSITTIKDLNIDGINDLVIGANGFLKVVFLDSTGNVKSYQKISPTEGNFQGIVGSTSLGYSVSNIGDLNKDGIEDIITTSIGNSGPDLISSALWVMFLNNNGKVKSHQKIANDSGNYNDTIRPYVLFGNAISYIGDIDSDGNSDIAIGCRDDSFNNIKSGRGRILYLNQNGTVKSIKRIDNNSLNFSGVLKDGDNFGTSLSGGFDLDGDFKNDIIVGSPRRDDGGIDKGAIYLLSLDGAVHPTPPKALWRVNVLSGNQNTVFNFTQYSTGFPNAYKWSITPNTFTYQSGTSDTSANPIIKFNATANYSVQLKVTNPFSSDSLLRSSYISVQTVGLNNLTKNTTAISIFPNPTNGLVQIQSPISIQSILVFDITGKQLLQQEPNTQTDEININNLPQGLYQIHVQTEMGVLVKKLVKE